jgi:anti-sigma28 factor (negative regulator of flagellin synthesis)
MTEIHHINGTYGLAPQVRVLPTRREKAPEAAPVGPELPGDRVEISEQATLMQKLNKGLEIRGELVRRIRAEIEAGTYETPERINATVDILLNELTGRTR